jgi:hypothetical protein
MDSSKKILTNTSLILLVIEVAVKMMKPGHDWVCWKLRLGV